MSACPGHLRVREAPFDNGVMLALALVVAHPDDDAYGIAGTVALPAADEGFGFILITPPTVKPATSRRASAPPPKP